MIVTAADDDGFLAVTKWHNNIGKIGSGFLTRHG